VRSIQLIVNADDFGMSKDVNEAVVRAFKEGVLTSCSLMVTGEAFDEAIQLAKENRGLAVGIHLVTVRGRSVLPRSEIPALVDEKGLFACHPGFAGLKYYFSKQARAQLRKELAAQFEKFQSTGLPLSHIDAHLHMHVHPVIFNAALELGERFGVRRMRVPEDELSLALRFDRSSFLKKIIQALLFSLLARFMRKKLKAKHFAFPERVYGHFQSGKMDEAYFLYALENLRAESNEIYFHPALREGGQKSDERLHSRIEYEALTSQKVIERLRHLKIRLTNYPELELCQ
jgi:hopanoid biosynthesis associated protein HpnK